MSIKVILFCFWIIYIWYIFLYFLDHILIYLGDNKNINNTKNPQEDIFQLINVSFCHQSKKVSYLSRLFDHLLISSKCIKKYPKRKNKSLNRSKYIIKWVVDVPHLLWYFILVWSFCLFYWLVSERIIIYSQIWKIGTDNKSKYLIGSICPCGTFHSHFGHFF